MLNSSSKRELFLVSLLFLFLELAFIRWFPAQVLFLTFFSNTVLLASFLGLSLGCLAARQHRNYLAWTPVLLLVSVGAGAAMESVRLALQDILDVGGNKASPQMVYFGTEARITDVASFAVPIELVVGLFFLLIAMTMVGIGQALGRRFAALNDPVQAYTINIAGSLAGVLLFQALAWLLSPFWWFTLVAVGLGYLLLLERTRWPIALLALVPLLLWLPDYFSLGVIREKFPVESWSPYYRINYSPETRTIVVNLLGHQNIVSRNDPFPAYALPYLLNRDAGQAAFRDILIIGAGSGNDVSRALQWTAPDARIDAVEIDPVIQKLGAEHHPDRPYADPRVRVHLTDGRNFLRSTNKKYDLIIFALIDSLVLHSSVSNLRLESYLFTSETMAEVRECLKPGGLFAMYNYFRQGWIVSRLVKTVGREFEQAPLVLSLPHRDAIGAEQKADGFTVLFAGDRAKELRRAFHEMGPYVLDTRIPPTPATPSGFGAAVTPESTRLSPTRVQVPPDLRTADDEWPFLYLQRPMIPDLSWHGMAIIAVASLVMLRLFGWRTERAQVTWQNAAMFFLGAGFMLVETKAVVHLALVFGSTWVVNTAVFSALLLLILAANVYVFRQRPASLRWYFVGLLITLGLNLMVPLDVFLGLPWIVQGIAAGTLVMSPVFFSGVVFATLLAGESRPEQALAYNTAGAILGGVLETTSLLIGFQYLVAVTGLIYLAAFAAMKMTGKATSEPVVQTAQG